MALTFYPQTDDVKGTLTEKIEILMEASQRFKATVLDESTKVSGTDASKRSVPREQLAAFNWEEIARVLRAIRELPESNKIEKSKKGELLAKLAEVYEVLRGAKMSKLEAVRLALMGEANQLRGGAVPSV